VRSIEFHPEAQEEFISGAQFYENQAEGLGLDFILTVQRTYERLLRFPAIGRPFGRRLRRLLVPKFPYGLLYRVEPNASTSWPSCTLTVDQATGGRASENDATQFVGSGPGARGARTRPLSAAALARLLVTVPG
jgi:hypothetical protein